MSILAVDEVMLRGNSVYDLLLQDWRRRGATFLWGGYPNDPSSWLVDGISGKVGRLNGGMKIGAFGPGNPDGVDDFISFDTNGGFSQRGAIAVLINNKFQTTHGAYIKVGGPTNGIGFGMGLSSLENDGTLELAVIENIAWIVNSAAAPKAGLSIRVLASRSSDNVTYCKGGAWNYGTPYAADQIISINGYMTGRNINNPVLAAAVFPNVPHSDGTALDAWIVALINSAPALAIAQYPDVPDSWKI